MAKIKLNPAITQLQGRVGKLVFRQQQGRTILSELPDTTPRRSTAQRKRQAEFKAAACYARATLADPLQRELYQQLAEERSKPVNAVLISDYLHPPVIDRIELSDYHGRPGDRIRMLATDDVEVVSVTVAIANRAGSVLEQGPATKCHGVWNYAATTAPSSRPLTISVTAVDRPGHGTTRSEIVS